MITERAATSQEREGSFEELESQFAALWERVEGAMDEWQKAMDELKPTLRDLAIEKAFFDADPDMDATRRGEAEEKMRVLVGEVERGANAMRDIERKMAEGVRDLEEFSTLVNRRFASAEQEVEVAVADPEVDREEKRKKLWAKKDLEYLLGDVQRKLLSFYPAVINRLSIDSFLANEKTYQDLKSGE